MGSRARNPGPSSLQAPLRPEEAVGAQEAPEGLVTECSQCGHCPRPLDPSGLVAAFRPSQPLTSHFQLLEKKTPQAGSAEGGVFGEEPRQNQNLNCGTA